MYVTEKSDVEEGDYDDHNILVADKVTQNYESYLVPGIQICYNMIAFRSTHESDEVYTTQTLSLRDGICGCDSWRGAIKSDDYKICRFHFLLIQIMFLPDCSISHYQILHHFMFCCISFIL